MTIKELIELARDLADRTLYHYTATGERWDNSHSDDQSKVVARQIVEWVDTQEQDNVRATNQAEG